MDDSIEYRNPEADNPVTSFNAGVIISKGEDQGICLKFSFYDNSELITHWAIPQYGDLINGLRAYMNHLGSDAFMFRAFHNPKLVDMLPKRHPYNTLIEEKPSLSEEEIGQAAPQTLVEAARFVSRGPTFVIRANFVNSGDCEIFLHEYTAFSLLGYLDEMVQAYAVLSGPVSGNA